MNSTTLQEPINQNIIKENDELKYKIEEIEKYVKTHKELNPEVILYIINS